VAHLVQVALTHPHLVSPQPAAVEEAITQQQETLEALAVAAVEMEAWGVLGRLDRVIPVVGQELGQGLTLLVVAAVLVALGQMDLVMETPA
jgi:hypothetical protein